MKTSDYEPLDRFNEALGEMAQKHLAVVEDAAKAADVRYRGVTVTSDYAADEIVKVARKSKCDLIVMAPHGQHGLSELLLGSETQKVLANTKISVLVYR
jgi:nucleotide-binding universal stress UspA family protein